MVKRHANTAVLGDPFGGHLAPFRDALLAIAGRMENEQRTSQTARLGRSAMPHHHRNITIETL
jgi:hypothetical protein